jgi:hypothetical protein
MAKICLIRQPAGLGDIFFTQKIAKTVLKEKRADQVIWPVIKEYFYLSDYLIGDGIVYVDENVDFPFKGIYISDPSNIIDTEELLYIPLQRADRTIKNLPIMQTKFGLVNMIYSDWDAFLEFKRNYEREKILEAYIKPQKPYTLINDSFGSKDYAYLNNKRETAIKENAIFMKYLGFDNIFDWLGLIEGAQEIHTVDTAWCYLFKKLGIKNVTVYSRKPSDVNFFKYVYDIFDPDWKYVL